MIVTGTSPVDEIVSMLGVFDVKIFTRTEIPLLTGTNLRSRHAIGIVVAGIEGIASRQSCATVAWVTIAIIINTGTISIMSAVQCGIEGQTDRIASTTTLLYKALGDVINTRQSLCTACRIAGFTGSRNIPIVSQHVDTAIVACTNCRVVVITIICCRYPIAVGIIVGHARIVIIAIGSGQNPIAIEIEAVAPVVIGIGERPLRGVSNKQNHLL